MRATSVSLAALMLALATSTPATADSGPSSCDSPDAAYQLPAFAHTGTISAGESHFFTVEPGTTSWWLHFTLVSNSPSIKINGFNVWTHAELGPSDSACIEIHVVGGVGGTYAVEWVGAPIACSPLCAVPPGI